MPLTIKQLNLAEKYSVLPPKVNDPGVVVRGLQEVPVPSLRHAEEAWQHGRHQRVTAATGMNDRSSRSHCIFMLRVTRPGRPYGDKLSIVDLAGSECIKKTCVPGKSHAANKETVEEAKAINQSLSTLGLVINRLVKLQSTRSGDIHVPYRSSKLTRVLQDSLGGGSRTALTINCSISSLQVAETLSTLRFGTRARMCVNTAPSSSCEEPMLLKTLRAARQELQRLQARALYSCDDGDSDGTPFSGLSALSLEQESVSTLDFSPEPALPGGHRSRFAPYGMELSLVQEADCETEDLSIPCRLSLATTPHQAALSLPRPPRTSSRRASRRSRRTSCGSRGILANGVSFVEGLETSAAWEHPLTISEKRSRLVAILTKEVTCAEKESSAAQDLAAELRQRCEGLQAEAEWLRAERDSYIMESNNHCQTVQELTACCAALYVQALMSRVQGKGPKGANAMAGAEAEAKQALQDARAKTAALDEEKQSLQEHARELEAAMSKLHLRFDEETAERKRLEMQATESAERCKAAETAVQNLQQAADSARRGQDSEKDQLSTRAADLQHTVDKLQQQLEEERSSHHAQLQQTLQAADAEAEEQHALQEDSKAKTAALHEEKQSLQEQARELEAAMSQLQLRFDEETAERKRLEMQAAQSAERCKAAETAVQNLQQEADSARRCQESEKDQLSTRAADLQHTVDKLQQLEEERSRHHAQLQQRLHAAVAEAEEHHALLEDARANTASLGEEKQSLQEQARGLEAAMSQLQLRFDEETAERKRLEMQAAQSAERCKVAETAVQNLLQEADSTRRGQESEKDQLSTRAADLQHTVDKLQQQLEEERSRHHAQLQQRLHAAVAEAEEHHALLEDARAKTASLVEEKQSLQEQARELEAAMSKLQLRFDEETAERKRLEMQAALLAERCKAAETAVQNLLQEADSTRHGQESEKDQLSTRTADLQHTVDKLQQQLEEERSRHHTELHETLQAAGAEAEEQHALQEDSKAKTAALHEEKQSLQEQARELEAAMSQLQLRFDEETAERKRLEMQAAQSAERCKEAETAVQNLQQEADSAQLGQDSEKDQLSTQAADLQHTVDKLQQQLEEERSRHHAQLQQTLQAAGAEAEEQHALREDSKAKTAALHEEKQSLQEQARELEAAMSQLQLRFDTETAERKRLEMQAAQSERCKAAETAVQNPHQEADSARLGQDSEKGQLSTRAANPQHTVEELQQLEEERLESTTAAQFREQRHAALRTDHLSPESLVFRGVQPKRRKMERSAKPHAQPLRNEAEQSCYYCRSFFWAPGTAGR
ncbi:unnamed protein product [Effrenium voratum]|uniref:Kinesin motor domain-containing protein n=1 Tax=Effrenium voratum TaxID=2562239 RepID=A0AA36NJ56_9DINO|nr:unnamed protein product [Effrenium voratum]